MTQILNISMSDYLSHAAYGASDLIKMGRSFAYWKYRKDNPEPPGRAFTVGSATHLALQSVVTNEPALMKQILVFTGDGSWRTKAFEKFVAENKGCYCLDREEDALVTRMVSALTSEPEVMDYLKGAIAEPTIMGNYPNTNVMCKVRPDYLHKERRVSINLKTTTDASESGFIYAAKDWGYDWQSAFYVDILSKEFGKPFDEVHILVEKTPEGEPCPIKIFSFGEDTLGWARTQLQAILERIPECEQSHVWPKSPVRLETIDLPLHCRKIVSL